MGKFLIIIQFFFFTICSGQNIEKLQNDNGFLEYKFGTTPNENLNLVKLKKFLNLKNLENYYNPYETKLFGFDINNNIAFVKNKLSEISYSIEYNNRDVSVEEFNLIKNILESLYGERWFTMNDVNGFSDLNINWKIGDLSISLRRNDITNEKVTVIGRNYRTISLSFTNNKLHEDGILELGDKKTKK